MAYKNPDKQRKAVKLATQRYRLRLKGITRVSRVTGITLDNEVQSVIPSNAVDVKPTTKPLREECITCAHLGGDENDRAICAAVDGCVYDKTEPEPQSYNPMMVGYVPPTDWG